jgi:DNA invertase Pin-like site-specific DNA recombinase
MIKLQYDPHLPYKCLQYGRMSDDAQNPRSPDTQFITIDETIARLRYPWRIANQYRDDALTGRYMLRRPGFLQMLRDIELKIVIADLILVDTFERIGRAEEIGEIRRKLARKHGILIVSALNNFADPTGLAGKAMAAFEELQATQDNVNKAHMVMRGKRDAARRKRWPGGVVPLGYMLKTITEES